MATAEDLAKLEAAAQCVLAPPDRVTNEERKNAENFFISLRSMKIPLNICQEILGRIIKFVKFNFLETTSNHFVMFQIVQVLLENVLRYWTTFQPTEIQAINKYLLSFPVNRISTPLPNFVVSEVLKSAARIIKRLAVSEETETVESEDQKTNSNMEYLFELLGNLLSSDNDNLQALGLSIIEELVTEFSTSWRSSKISITWDFHIRAKREFEHTMLKRLLELALTSLSRILSQTGSLTSSQIKVCEKFLQVTTVVLSWNFAQRFLMIRLRLLAYATSSVALRPPSSWRDIFLNGEIISFFMQLHTKIRHIENLSANSMNSLIQLASCMGEVLESPHPIIPTIITEDELSINQPSPQVPKKPHDIYVHRFMQCTIDTFSEVILEHEMLPVTNMIYKLFTYHPVMIFFRTPQPLISNFTNFVVETIIRLSGPAIQFAITKNEHTFHESLHNLFNCWAILVRSSSIAPKELQDLINAQNEQIIIAFFKAVLSVPYGNRTTIHENENSEDDEDEGDRKMWSDILNPIGFFGQNALLLYSTNLIQVFNERLQKFLTFTSAITEIELRSWQEDLNWILLLTSFLLLESDSDYAIHLPDEIIAILAKKYKSNEFQPTNFEDYILSCIQNPNPSNVILQGADPITLIAGHICLWNSLEHSALVNMSAIKYLSPELMRNSLWSLSRLVAALTPNESRRNLSFFDDEEKFDDPSVELIPKIPVEGPFARTFVEFILHRAFNVLLRMPGEKELCSEAVLCIVSLMERRAELVGTSTVFFDYLSQIQLSTLPARRNLIRALVLIGSSISKQEIQQSMYQTILQPLSDKFLLMPTDIKGSNVDSDIVDLLECFCGVTDAAQCHSAGVLFEPVILANCLLYSDLEFIDFLNPVFSACATLLQKKFESQIIVNSVLELFKSLTSNLMGFIDAGDQFNSYYNTLLKLLEAYKNTQTAKFHITITPSDEEETTSDLVKIMEILSHCVSKCFLPLSDKADEMAESAATVALIGLEMLLPIFSLDFLKIPTLCDNFFSLLLIISELAPICFARIKEQMMMDFLTSIRLALDGEFGMNHTVAGLQIINNMTTHFCVANDASSMTLTALSSLVEKVFDSCMQYSCEVDVFPDATNALYSLICLNKDGFLVYINRLLSNNENMAHRGKLELAFSKLLPDFDLPMSRTGKRVFRERFEKFLNDVSGLLYLCS